MVRPFTFFRDSPCSPVGGTKVFSPTEPRLEPGVSEDVTVVFVDVPETPDQPPEDRAEAVPLDEKVVDEELRKCCGNGLRGVEEAPDVPEYT